MKRALAALLVAASLPAAGAPRQKVAVLDVRAVQGVGAGTASILTAIIAGDTAGEGYDVMSQADIAALIGFEKQRQMLGCGDDSACLAEIGGALGVDYVISTQVGKIGSRFHISLQLLDARRQNVASRVSIFSETTEDALAEAAQRAVAQALSVAQGRRAAEAGAPMASPGPQAAAPPSPAASPPPPPGPPRAAAGKAQSVPAIVTFKDGQELRGQLLARDAAGATLELPGGARIVVPEAQIARVQTGRPGETSVRSADPNRTRYLYSPSGFMLGQGEGYLSQTELLLTTVHYGLTDHLTLGLGTSIPFLFVEDGMNLVGTLKVGGSVGEYVHLAAVGTGLWLPGVDSGTTVGLLAGALTLGTPDHHLGVALGPPFIAGSSNDLGDLVVVISGNVRVSDRIALVSENWVVPGADGGYALSGAVRFIGQRLGVDAGLIYFEDAPIPIPWLDFTFNFGRR